MQHSPFVRSLSCCATNASRHLDSLRGGCSSPTKCTVFRLECICLFSSSLGCNDGCTHIDQCKFANIVRNKKLLFFLLLVLFTVVNVSIFIGIRHFAQIYQQEDSPNQERYISALIAEIADMQQRQEKFAAILARHDESFGENRDRSRQQGHFRDRMQEISSSTSYSRINDRRDDHLSDRDHPNRPISTQQDQSKKRQQPTQRKERETERAFVRPPPGTKKANHPHSTVANDTPEASTCADRINNFAFIKTHKTGSSTLTNVFHRYGYFHKLRHALPKGNLYYGWPVKDLLVSSVEHVDGKGFPYDIMASAHGIYDPERFATIVGQHAKKVTVMREPLSHFRSSWHYWGLYREMSISADDFLRSLVRLRVRIGVYHNPVESWIN